MGTYADRAKAWDAAVAGMTPPGPGSSVDIVTSVLESQLDRAVSAIKLNDDKASIIIPAVGAISGVVGSNVRPDIVNNPILALLGLGVGLAAVGAIVLAVMALSPKTHSNGPVALQAVQGAGVPLAVGKLAYLKALGFAVQSAEDLVTVKAFWVQWAFRLGAAGVITLTVFAGLGGFVPGGAVK